MPGVKPTPSAAPRQPPRFTPGGAMWALVALLLTIARGGDVVAEPTHPRTIDDVEADLRVQSVVLARERARHHVRDDDADVVELDALLEEWVALHAAQADA